MTKEEIAGLQAKIGEYRAVLDNDPGSAAFAVLSDVCRQLGMLDEALLVAQRGVEAMPEFAPGLLALGRAQMEFGELQEAYRSFNRAFESDPDDSNLLQSMARLCVLRGEKTRACELLTRAVDLDPEDCVAANLLKSWDESACESAAADEPMFATATVAELCVRQGQLERACTIYRELLCRQPDDITLRDRLVHVESLLADQAAVQDDMADIASVPEATGSSAAQVVATLQKWLSAIQARRDYVQKHSAGHC